MKVNNAVVIAGHIQKSPRSKGIVSYDYYVTR